MSRRVFLLGVGLAAVALAFVVTDSVIGRAPGVTETNARRLRAGMSLEEIEAILGDFSPWQTYAGEVDRVKLKELCDPAPCVEVPRNQIAATKEGEKGSVVVYLSTVGRLQKAEWLPSGGAIRFRKAGPPSFLARLRSWVGW
jgi:hypothetical protein